MDFVRSHFGKMKLWQFWLTFFQISADVEKKWAQSVQLVRVSFFRSDFLQNPYFSGKSFSKPWLLQGNVGTHTGEKPLSCTNIVPALLQTSQICEPIYRPIWKNLCPGCQISLLINIPKNAAKAWRRPPRFSELPSSLHNKFNKNGRCFQKFCGLLRIEDTTIANS